jgi:hypothetical protein
MDERIAIRFKALEAKLAALYPNAIIEAEALAAQVVDPSVADADAVWQRVWDKPLFANTKVAIGVASVAKLKPYMAGAWRTWGAQGSDFVVEKIGKGTSVRSFRLVGPLAVEVRQTTSIALHRLYAIQGAAAAMRARAATNTTPYGELVQAEVGKSVRAVQSEMGPGWGHITVLHFFTDLGVACKPDLHLVRAVRHLGMSLDLRNGQVPNFADAVTINHRVRALADAVYGSVEPMRLRYLDKILMELSRLRVINMASEYDGNAHVDVQPGLLQRTTNPLDQNASVARLKAFRSAWDQGDVIHGKSGLTAEDVDTVLSILATAHRGSSQSLDK